MNLDPVAGFTERAANSLAEVVRIENLTFDPADRDSAAELLKPLAAFAEKGTISSFKYMTVLYILRSCADLPF